MRPVQISNIIGRIRDSATADALKELELASNEADIVDIAAAFTITGAYTETRELEVGVSTLAETQAFIATFIDDLKRGGRFRTT
jgi:hypothetical protein